MLGPTVQDPPQQPSTTVQISNMVVRVMHDYTGRGPTKAWTTIHGELVTVLLSDSLTRGERSLVAGGRASTVLNMRKAFQGAMREELVSGVETILDRKVVAFMSDNHIDPDVALEGFVLAPDIPAAPG